jgi:hypothetical protein
MITTQQTHPNQGLGRTSTGGSVSNTLLAIEQQYVSPEVCNQEYGGGISAAQTMCAEAANKGSCNGGELAFALDFASIPNEL